MPEEKQRPPLGNHRSSSSHRHLKSNANADQSSDSTTDVAPTHHKAKAKSHHVASRIGMHARNQSHGKLHKAAKVQHTHPQHHTHAANVISPQLSPTSQPPLPRRQSDAPISATTSATNLLRNASNTSLKKNTSNTSLKRNKSDITKRVKSATHLKRATSHVKVEKAAKKDKTAVRFNIGSDHDDDAEDVEGDGWTEASGSASPNLSRSASRRSSIGSTKSSALQNPTNQEEGQSHSRSQSQPDAKVTMTRNSSSHMTPYSADPSQITSRLLQRTPSHNVPPQMSDVSATASQNGGSPSSNPYFKNAATVQTGMPQTPYTPHSSKGPVSSRFIGEEANKTPNEAQRTDEEVMQKVDDARRVKSASNLKTASPSRDDDADQAGSFLPQSRKNSSNAYSQPQQSRVQQKLWLQRASSNMESQQISSANAPVSVNGSPALALNMNPLVGYDSRDVRVKIQLEKTGMEYLVVRRYQDPVGRALRRLAKLPGNEKMRRIPVVSPRGSKTTLSDAVSMKYGLSQSLRDRSERNTKSADVGAARTSSKSNTSPDPDNFRASSSVGSGESNNTAAEEETSLAERLRSLWEQSHDIESSQ